MDPGEITTSPRCGRLDRLRQGDGFLGLIMEGKRFDIELPEYYLETLKDFREGEAGNRTGLAQALVSNVETVANTADRF